MYIDKQQIKQVLEQIEAVLDSSRSNTHLCDILPDFGFLKQHLSKVDNNGLTFAPEEDVGGEGQGSHAHVILKVSKDGFEDTYICFDGYYASYSGFEYDGSFTIVEPYGKHVRAWKEVE